MLLEQSFRYGIATAVSASLTLALPVGLVEVLEVRPQVAVGIALAAAFVTNFLTVKYFVFKSTAPIALELWRFALTSGVFRVLEYLAFLLLTGIGAHYLPSLLAVIVTSFAAKFVVHRQLVFSAR